ncbi:uncharacterized protein FFB20_12380 [Fusarium fujikuroi]|uniref:Ricin B lectin domain-containing protein n=2 Tax=Fusarium fujikuroi TaxID=5127 RepID=S0DPD8_GIBF5|nr:uncharacterized protein FFUJ_00102 [Fusarium fujikuroi IMI 58289]KLP00045.1 uncharacterized protein Y057_8599 [Fusarium fujikuroi]CCT63267.1 uncharacterized protein FFUJ_00102 [Fusarium fujikuroi IMI 58289]SCN65914.1 uncharacterized protein FFE2_00139 [Fusarium fujikuroi]SCN68822.1 uncharacterized protein FFC1_00136 [Fusarium fujikuroi]SCN71246.1 uncharacterized protein FFM5_00102 [Fusarium fujikuroi]
MPEDGRRGGEQWIQKRKVNVRSQVGGMFVDLKGGGGGYPPVISFDNKTWETNPNQHWIIFSTDVPGDSRVMIKSPVTGGYLSSYGHRRHVDCETSDLWDEKFQWFLDGGDINNITEDQVVSFRSCKYPHLYLDLFGGKGESGQPFITFEENNNNNQKFRLWFR